MKHDMSETILTLHISGAHFSTCMFCLQTGAMVPQAYQRIPISYKLKADRLLQVWKNAIANLPAVYLANLAGCAIAVPLPFIDEGVRDVGACADRYVNLYPVDLISFFADTLNLHPDDVQLIYNGSVYLKGALSAHPHLDVPGVASVYLGTDLSSSVVRAQGIQHLGLEGKRYLNKRANDYLSAQALLKSYYDETGISVINVEQLVELSKENATAREVLKDFLRRAFSFLSREAVHNRIHTLILGGDVIRYHNDLVPFPKQERTPKIICWSDEDDLFHRGAFLLSAELNCTV